MTDDELMQMKRRQESDATVMFARRITADSMSGEASLLIDPEVVMLARQYLRAREIIAAMADDRLFYLRGMK